MMVGVSLRQSRGHWDTTTANAWGAVAARKFAGDLSGERGDRARPALTLGAADDREGRGRSVADFRLASFPLPAAATPLRLAQAGGAGPWAMVQVSAAVPLRAPLSAGYRLTRKVDVVQARTPGTLTRGDVRAGDADRRSLRRTQLGGGQRSDPGGRDRSSATLAGSRRRLAQGDDSAGVQPSYVERGRDAWRGYFAWLPRGTATVSYTMRLNGAGRFSLPPSRVEAMYSPAIRAAVPNAGVVVAQR